MKTRLLRLSGSAERFGLLLILLLALWLRVQNAEANRYTLDHAYAFHQALRTLDQGELPLVGQYTSVLFASPPLAGYILLPIVAATRSPLAAFLFVAALNSLAVWLTWKIGKQLIPNGSALVACFLIAINPWVIEYSRVTWLTYFLPLGIPLVLCLLIPLVRGTAREPGRQALALLVALTLLTQSYLLAFAILPSVGLLLLLFWQRVPWRGLLPGILFFVLVTALYMVGLVQHPDTSLGRLRQFEGSGARFSPWAIEHTLRMATGDDYAYARGTLLPQDDVQRRQRLDDIAQGVLLLAILAGLFQAGRAQNPKQREAALIILIWFVVPMAMMLYTSQDVHPYYLLLTLPAAALLAGWGSRPLLQSTWGRGVLLLLGGIVTLTFITNTLAHSEEARRFPGKEGLKALPVGIGLELGKLLNQSGADIVIADAGPWILESLAGRLFRREPLLETLDLYQVIVARGGPVTYVLFNRPELPYPHESISLADGHSIQVTKIVPGEIAVPLDYTTEQGIRLRGYTLPSLTPGQRVPLRLAWQVDALGEPTSFFQPFVHLYDRNDQRLLVVHGAGVPGSDWRVGDWQLHTLWLDLPADAQGPFTLQTGLYDPFRQTNAIFTNAPDGWSPVVSLAE